MAEKTSYSRERILESIDHKICTRQVNTFILGSVLSVITAIAFLLGTRMLTILLIALPFPVLYLPVLISALLKKKALLKDEEAYVFFTAALGEWKKARFKGYFATVDFKEKGQAAVTLKTAPIAVAVPFSLLMKIPLVAFENKKVMIGYNQTTGKVVVVKIVR